MCATPNFSLADSLAILTVGLAGNQQAMRVLHYLEHGVVPGETTIWNTQRFDTRIAIINFSISPVPISRRSHTL